MSNSFEQLDKQMENLELQEAKLSRLCQQPNLSWDSVVAVGKSLGFILHGERCMARFANDSRQAVELETELATKLVGSKIGKCGKFRRMSGGGFRNSWSDRHVALRLNSVLPESLPVTSLLQCHQRRERLNKIVRSFADLAAQFRVSFTDTLPQYATIKRVMPIGGRDVYSMLLAFSKGTINDNLPDYQEWFGFSSPKFGDVQRQPKLRTIREKSGKAPSVKKGRELVDQLARNIPSRNVSREERVRKLRVDTASGFNLWHACPSVRKASYDTACHKWKAMSLRIMGITENEYRNRLPTVITGRPERLAGDDYFAPCVANVEIMGPSKAGFVLMRSGWNDVVHVASVDDVADCQSRLDSASKYYFQQLKGKQDRRKSLADLVRSCRKIPCFTLADSYAAGNCQPGTRQFCQQLAAYGLPSDLDAIPGNRLARYWRKAGYPQQDRFAGVVQRLASQLMEFHFPV